MRWTLGILCAATVVHTAHAQQPQTKSPNLTIMVPTVSVPSAVQQSLKIDPAQLTTLLAQSILAARVGDVKTTEDIRAVVEQNSQQQLLGCQDMKCVLDLGKLAGADLLVRGEAGLVGNRLLVSATLINVVETRVVGIVTRAVPVDALANGGLNPLAAELFPGSAPSGAGAVGAAPVQAGVPSAVGLGTGAGQPATPAVSDVRERVVVTGRPWTDVDAAVRATALGKASEVVNAVGGFQSVTTEELRAVLQNEADAQALGAAETNTVQKVAAAVKAPFLVQLELGRAGRAWVTGASLVDTRTADVVNRSSLVFQDEKQLLEAVNVVTRRLLGQSATLPSPDADPSRLENRLQALVNEALGKYRELPQGGAAGLVIVPFGETSAEPRQRKLGTQMASFVGNLTNGAAGVSVATKDKVKELNKQHDLSNPLVLAPQAFGEMGVYLGAQALLVGTVGDVGTDYLLQARLVKVAGGQVLWSGNAMFPKAKPGSLLPKKVIISRSRADAITRAAVPGLAQFTAGPIGIVKGAVFVGVIALGVLVIPGAIALASLATAVLVTIANASIDPFAGYISEKGALWAYRSVPPVADLTDCSTASIDASDTAAVAGCGRAQVGAGVGLAAGLGAFAAGVAFALGAYGLSFVDAAIFGIKSEEVNFESAE